MLLRVLAVWCALLLAAFVNGAFRELALVPMFGGAAAHVISSILLSGIIAIVAWRAITWLHPSTLHESWLIGDAWVFLTIGFEFLGGHFLFGHSWQSLLADYNLLQGRIWELVLVVTLLAPIAAAWGHHLFHHVRPTQPTRPVRHAHV